MRIIEEAWRKELFVTTITTTAVDSFKNIKLLEKVEVEPREGEGAEGRVTYDKKEEEGGEGSMNGFNGGLTISGGFWCRCWYWV
ncbi:unnamed protein product [Onchocerca flexuosa]|nr:unnamed protein product [Onchocerca flexuosa]